MVSSINLYHKPIMTRNKVHDVVSDDMLTQKLHAQSISSQIVPKHILRKRRILSVLSCELLQQYIPVWRSRLKTHSA